MTIKIYRVYLRISNGGRVIASPKPNWKPMRTSNGIYLPTIQIALDLKIDEKEFDGARILLEQNIERSQPAVNVVEHEVSE
jgi:hypothetical protein